MVVEDVVDSVVDHVLELLLLADHESVHRLLLVWHHVDSLNFVLKCSRVIGFGPRDERSEGRIENEVLVEEFLLLTLIGPAHLVEPSHVVVLHFFD